MVVCPPAGFTLFHSRSCGHLSYPLELCSLRRPHSHVWQWMLAIVWTTLWQCLVMIMVQVANLLKPRLKNCTILPYSVRQKRVIRTVEVQVMRKLASPLGGKSCKEYAAICNPPTSHLHYTIPFSDLSSWYSPRYEFEVLDMSKTNFPLGPLSLFYNNFIFFSHCLSLQSFLPF